MDSQPFMQCKSNLNTFLQWLFNNNKEETVLRAGKIHFDL